jgi:SAM-dependent MidA family methyltransferase
MASASTELEQRLIERIRRDGPITFRDFMQAALYDPELGYYNTERLKIGATGDYYTSSNVHPAFGAVLAKAFVELWSSSAEPLTIVEFGAGTGRLASDVLLAMRDDHASVFRRMSYVIIEASPAMRKRQRDALAVFADRVRWCELEEIERASITGIAFSNEFVDALPVHRVCFKGGAITEAYLTVPNDEAARLTLTWGEPSNKRLTNYVERIGVSLRENQEIEINLDAVDWLARIARVLRHGFLTTIDYGEIAQLLWAPDRSSGTLRSFHKHQLIASPLELIGEQDITASVNFTALTEYGRDFGFEVVSYERQTAFLIRMGLIERIASEHGSTESLDDLKERLAVKNLFVPGGISNHFRVLIQRR